MPPPLPPKFVVPPRVAAANTAARPSVRLPKRGELMEQYEILDDGRPEGDFILYRVRHTQLDTERLLKLPRPEHLKDGFSDRYGERVALLAGLTSPYLRRPLESFYDAESGLACAVFEEEPAATLRTLRKNGAYSGEQILAVLLAAAGGLDALEQAGLHHGRLTPGNVVFDRDSAQIRLAGLDQPEGQGPGDYQYSPPAGSAATGSAGDLYSLGVIAFEMAAGQIPRVVRGVAPDLQSEAPRIPEPIVKVISRLLALDAGSRYRRASELDAALKTLLAEFTPADPREEAGEKAAPPKAKAPRKFPFLPFVILLTLLVAAAAGVRGWRYFTSLPPPVVISIPLSEDSRARQAALEKEKAESQRLQTLIRLWKEGGE